MFCRRSQKLGLCHLLKGMTSPNESFDLPCYIQPLADALVAHPPRSYSATTSRSRKSRFGVHMYLDLVASEGISSSTSASSSEYSE